MRTLRRIVLLMPQAIELKTSSSKGLTDNGSAILSKQLKYS
jgi:hypothetical protein